MQLKSLGNLISVIDEVKKLGSIYKLGANSSKILETAFKELNTAQILTKLSTMALTDAQKLEMVQQFASDAASYRTTESLIALSTTQKAATVTTGGLSTAFKGLTSTLLSSPLFWGAVGVAGVYALIKGIDYFTESLAEAAETAQQSSEAWKSVQAEIDSLNTELETTTARIDELNAKDTLTIIEQEELERLKETTKELERNLSVQRSLERVASSEARDASKNILINRILILNILACRMNMRNTAPICMNPFQELH